jgi:TolB protein
VSPRHLDGLSWSPDDRRLIFSVYPNSNAFEKSTLYSVDVETRISTSLGRGTRPLWAPRGGRIAFELPGHAGGWPHLCVSRADGSGRKVLGKGGLLAWSPDGSRLAAVTPAGLGFGLVTMRSDGRGRRTIMRPPDAVLFVDWAR